MGFFREFRRNPFGSCEARTKPSRAAIKFCELNMKSLDDILFGFLIFFAIERFIRLFSNAIIEPWAQKRTSNENVVENWKLGTEFVFLIAACFVVYSFRKPLARLVT